MKAFLKNYQQSPTKVRMVTRQLKEKPVDVALNILSVLDKKCSISLRKLLSSAVSNSSKKSSDLVVSEIFVNNGIILKRGRMRARGRMAPIRRRRSHITIKLREK